MKKLLIILIGLIIFVIGFNIYRNMGFNLGSNSVDNVYLGNNQIDKIYQGGDLIWEHDTTLTEIWGTEIVEVTNPITGRTWMDRNLGATRAATSSTDSEAYGHLFQWGRNPDGHELRTSETTTTLSSTDVPGHGDFITSSSSPYDWRSPQNHNLWQGDIVAGWRLPTVVELEEERLSWSSNNADGAYNSVLKLPSSGSRDGSSGSLGSVGSYGAYWSSTVDGNSSRLLLFLSSIAVTNLSHRAYGSSVRLIKDQSI